MLCEIDFYSLTYLITNEDLNSVTQGHSMSCLTITHTTVIINYIMVLRFLSIFDIPTNLKNLTK